MKALPSDVSFEEKYNFFVNRFYKTPTSCKSPTWKRNRLIFFAQENTELRHNPMLRWGDIKYLLNKTNALLVSLLHEDVPRPRFGGSAKRTTFPACETDLQVIYPSSDKFGESKTKIRCSKAPITLLVDGKERLQQLGEKLNVESSFCNANNEMLNVLDDLLIEFETCNALLGEFMQSQVHIPLEQAGNDKYVDEFARHDANSRGLSVWALLIVPFNYLQQMVRSSGRFGKIVIEFSRRINDFREYIFPSEELEFPDYDEKLNFLVGSMKKGVTCNKSYISYSLERQLERQCKKRNIFHNTPIENILQQWNANFEEETLTLVPYEYRPLIARWIRWSLMINYLRESLAKQCAVGVVGLVNSGKSKFVSSMFEVQTASGTTDERRTTIPLIYNLDEHIKGLDVIDFPGVDDRDESIPKIAELLFCLTRIVVFVVDYRKVHTESTKKWLSILEKENVPVLICLTFADRLFAELMGKGGDCGMETIKARVESQLECIKTKIGLPESGHQRDFKLAVFALDNDSKLNSDEGKAMLRRVGLCDELDVGRWIAEKLDDEYESHEISQNLLKYIENKKSSTIDSCKVGALFNLK
ncbi:uncharacterized protein LOC124434378 isoform X1 [Xenia sp. Carnegie-2017]|uniref:uncharacterized protein LOC124434378 isoform X1 n=1 Tax=Xenia sp. Carnegie-2017 TaxID=2897299 RepID=UPI001F047C13|nr:uncharacterized protein LOC124434378 isoform X1 [Xenia sp. Carnegie-2017]